MSKQNKLAQKILKASNIIAKKSRESSGNYIILSDYVARKLKKYELLESRRKKLNRIRK